MARKQWERIGRSLQQVAATLALEQFSEQRSTMKSSSAALKYCAARCGVWSFAHDEQRSMLLTDIVRFFVSVNLELCKRAALWTDSNQLDWRTDAVCSWDVVRMWHMVRF